MNPKVEKLLSNNFIWFFVSLYLAVRLMIWAYREIDATHHNLSHFQKLQMAGNKAERKVRNLQQKP